MGHRVHGATAVILTVAELLEITRRPRPSAQARVLRALGIPFRIHPIDGALLVDRETARAALGARVTAANDEPPSTYEVKFPESAHGQASRNRRPARTAARRPV